MQVWGIVVTPAGWCWDGMVAVGLAQCLPHGGQEPRDFWETQTQSRKTTTQINTNNLRLICENEVRNQTKLNRRANLIILVLQSGGWTLRHCEQPGLQCYFNSSFNFPLVTQQRTDTRLRTLDLDSPWTSMVFSLWFSADSSAFSLSSSRTRDRKK